VQTLSEAAAEALVASGAASPAETHRVGLRKVVHASDCADRSSLISSEPLTRDTSTWFEVPEYTAIIASGISGSRKTLPEHARFCQPEKH
jgi:hypothetical protein